METVETIKFKRERLGDYALIETPGKYELVATSDVTERNLVTDEDGKNPRYIASFKAIAVDNFPQLKEVFKDAEEVLIEQTNGLFLTANIWKTPGRQAQLPMKGEKVECNIDFVKAREGEGQVLRITNIKLRPALVANKLDISSFFKDGGAAIDNKVDATKELEHA